MADGRAEVDARHSILLRAEKGDASAPEASRFALVSHRTSSLAGRAAAPAAVFIDES